MNTQALRTAAAAVAPGQTAMHALSEFIPWDDAENVDVVLDRDKSGRLQVIVNLESKGVEPLEAMLLSRAMAKGRAHLWLVAR